MLYRKKMSITDAAMDKLRGIYESVKDCEDYGNGRFVRKILEEAELNLAERVMKLNPDEITEELIATIEECDISDAHFDEKPVQKVMGFACAPCTT
jgi:hypothetical protein